MNPKAHPPMVQNLLKLLVPLAHLSGKRQVRAQFYA